MTELKTKVNDSDVSAFIDSVSDEKKRKDSYELLKIFTEVTGEKPKMWGSSIIGFGQYHYKSERSTQEGDWMLTGFSPRKLNLTIYIMNGFDEYQDLLKQIGKYKTSRGCLYIKKLDDIDQEILKTLIKKSYTTTKKTYS